MFHVTWIRKFLYSVCRTIVELSLLYGVNPVLPYGHIHMKQLSCAQQHAVIIIRNNDEYVIMVEHKSAWCVHMLALDVPYKLQYGFDLHIALIIYRMYFACGCSVHWLFSSNTETVIAPIFNHSPSMPP